MKKFFLISLLYLIPAWNSTFAAIVEGDCDNWEKYHAQGGQTIGNFKALPSLMQQVINEQANLTNWLTSSEALKEDREDIKTKCNNFDIEEKQRFKIVELALEKLLNKYNDMETRARMPFVHHGDVLPGPPEDESGADYVRTKFIPKYINFMLIFMISFSVIMVIVGGIMFIYSSGDSEMTGRAKLTIMWAILGVVITIFAYAIVKFIIGIDFGL